MASKVPPSGIWCPAVTLFDRETDSLIPDDQAKYYSYLAKSGLAGLVILGTNAETFLLTREERKTLVEVARRAVGPDFPIMAGVGGHSTKQVLEFIADAADAGADYALVLPPAYFGKATTNAVIEDFYGDIATKGALPVVVYNFPAVCNGVDLDSQTIGDLARRYPSVVGVKLTCGSVAKITRLAAEFPPERFATFGGQSDFLIGGLSVGSAGAIAAFANVFPKTVSRIYSLWKSGDTKEALALHQKAALAEQACKAGIGFVKYAAAVNTASKAGVEDAVSKMKPRKPYQEPSQAAKDNVDAALAELVKIEDAL